MGRSTDRQHNMCSTGEPEDKRSCCPRRGFVGAHHLVRSPNGVIILERVNPLQKGITYNTRRGRKRGGQIVEGVALSERQTEGGGKKYSIVRRRRTEARSTNPNTAVGHPPTKAPKCSLSIHGVVCKRIIATPAAASTLSRDFGDSAGHEG